MIFPRLISERQANAIINIIDRYSDTDDSVDHDNYMRYLLCCQDFYLRPDEFSKDLTRDMRNCLNLLNREIREILSRKRKYYGC